MVLHGWKQIARYLGCGIRTAQRWEAQCALPVNRPRHHLRSPVLAQSEALDAWAAGDRAIPPLPLESHYKDIEQQLQELKRQVALLAGRNSEAESPRKNRPAIGDANRQLAAKAPSFEA